LPVIREAALAEVRVLEKAARANKKGRRVPTRTREYCVGQPPTRMQTDQYGAPWRERGSSRAPRERGRQGLDARLLQRELAAHCGRELRSRGTRRVQRRAVDLEKMHAAHAREPPVPGDVEGQVTAPAADVNRRPEVAASGGSASLLPRV